MITAGDFRKGVTVEMENGIWTIVDFQHVKPGKGAAFVRTKIKNIVTGAVLERTFNPTDKMPRAHIETKEMQYMYNDGDLYYFCLLYTSIPRKVGALCLNTVLLNNALAHMLIELLLKRRTERLKTGIIYGRSAVGRNV